MRTDQSVGNIDVIDGQSVHGWFISRQSGVELNEFELLIDGRPIGVFEASLQRDDLLAAEGILECGFRLDIADNLKSIESHSFTSIASKSVRIEIRSRSGVVVARTLLERHRIVAEEPPRPKPVASALTGLSTSGYLDRVDQTGAMGWAIDLSKPNAPVQLSLLVNGAEVYTFRTSELRNDLVKKGLPGARAGFRIPWPAHVLRPGSEIDVRFTSSRLPLRTSPKSIPGGRLYKGGSSYLDLAVSGAIPRITVIVPIFNAYDAVRECLASLIANSANDASLLLIDDNSTDPRVASLIEGVADDPRVRILRNGENLGYTRTINAGIAACGDDDVILLNSDTVVGKRWIETLRACAYSKGHVATVTPLSNNAGAFSVPDIGIENELPPYLSRVQFVRLVQDVGSGDPIEVPTGNGFCLYIKRRALNQVGVFDEVKFPRGYGEENDFCMRAIRAGWTHLVCDKLLVTHKRSQSFMGEKAQLISAGVAQVDSDYPEYRKLTSYFSGVEFSYLRHRIRERIRHPLTSDGLPRVLYVISTTTGGTPQTNLDLMCAMRGHYHALLLRCDSRALTLHELADGTLESRETYVLSKPIDPTTHASAEYDRVVFDWMYRYSIDVLHVRHIAWHGLGLAACAKRLGVPVIYSVHDFYTLCPAQNLLDDQLRYCGGKCTDGKGTDCAVELWPRGAMPQLKHGFVHRWRDMFRSFLADCDALVTTSRSTANTFCSVYPEEQSKLRVIPHGRDFSSFAQLGQRVKPGEKLRVLVPGNISASKGSRLIAQVARMDGGQRIEFHFLGGIDPALSGLGVEHGTYQREALVKKVTEIRPHIGIVLSVWAETYCHTLTEMWACGLPVLALELGAVAERLKSTGAGWLLDASIEASDLRDEMLRLSSDKMEFDRAMASVLKWQSSEGITRNTSAMASAYRGVYRTVDPTGHVVPRVGLLIKGKDEHPPTAHIRLLLPITRLARDGKCDPRVVSTGEVKAGALRDLDVLVIQRDAVPAEELEEILGAVNRWGGKLIYEIDDLLWDLPPDHLDHAIGKPEVESIVSLMRAASLVTTSTEVLAQRIREENVNVVVIPNVPDARLWTEPLDDAKCLDILTKSGLERVVKRLIYMGTNSHAADLAMIGPAIAELKKRFPELEVLQLGGGPLLPGARRLVPPAGYARFVPWFRAICTRCQVGLAPLRASPFNAAKSPIKVLDYGLAGLPSVCSAVTPYLGEIEHLEDGILCENVPEEWVQSITRLLSDATLLSRVASSAKERALGSVRRSSVVSSWSGVFGCEPSGSVPVARPTHANEGDKR